MAAFPATGGHAPPRQQRAGRSNGWTKDRRALFCAMLQACLNVRRAVASVNLSYSSAYQLKRRDPQFARDWAEALDNGYCDLELELMRQAIEGIERTETVHDASTGEVKQVKKTCSIPPGQGLRLLLAHRDEVFAFRGAEGARDDANVGARVRAEMDKVRARLNGERDDRGEDGGPGDED